MNAAFRRVSAEEMRTLQLGLLDAFDRHCRQCGLRYYLWAGTLLGAMRHRGFIPWDDDIDVAMPRGDFERLRRDFAASGLAGGFLLHDLGSDPLYPHLFVKFGDPRAWVFGSSPAPLCVSLDIFPIDRWPENRPLSTLAVLRLWLRLRWRNFCLPLPLRPGHEIRHRLLRNGLRPFHQPRMLRWANLQVERFIRRQQGRAVTVAVNFAGPPAKLDHRAYGEPVPLPFEGRILPAPAEPDAVLTHLYGDWRVPPPPGQRHAHPGSDAVWLDPQTVATLRALDPATRSTLGSLHRLQAVLPAADQGSTEAMKFNEGSIR